MIFFYEFKHFKPLQSETDPDYRDRYQDHPAHAGYVKVNLMTFYNVKIRLTLAVFAKNAVPFISRITLGLGKWEDCVIHNTADYACRQKKAELVADKQKLAVKPCADRSGG